MTVNSEEYQQEYDAERARLDEAAAQATTARGADGKFVAKEPAQAEPVAATTDAPAGETPAPEPTEQESLAELRERVAKAEAERAKAEKVAKDNQAWATKASQEAAQLRREREAQQREATKPAILDANPELAEAIRHVVSDPTSKNEQADAQESWKTAVEKVHPGIFDKSIDPELEKAVLKRFDALGPDVQDPLVAIREITEEKLAFAQRQVGQRFAAEAARQAKVSAMTMPGAGAGGGSRVAPDSDLAAVNRIKNMTDAEFAKEVRRVKGY